MTSPPKPSDLLAWYDRHRRELPWRVTPDMRGAGVLNDPYHVWLSEVMLQQTTVAAVKAYFEKFVRLWPRVEDLASAETEDVMKAWAGLGYYARARNLKKCAEAVARDHGGRFPKTSEQLRTLPGIGDYTSAAIAAIAFDEPVPVMDGNVERVISRIFRVEEALPAAKPILRGHLATLTPNDRPGDFAQAMMDLGATICTPKRPACALCPWRENCRALAEGDPELYPVKADKKAKPVRTGGAYVVIDRAGNVLLRKRPPQGLLGGMSEVPTTGWTSRVDGGDAAEHAPFPADWRPCGVVTHVFTHFELRLSVWRADLDEYTLGPPSSEIPPSVLPAFVAAIDSPDRLPRFADRPSPPSRGDIGKRHAHRTQSKSSPDAIRMEGGETAPHRVSPLEGEMPGRAEGGNATRHADGAGPGHPTPLAGRARADNGFWVPVTKLDGEALPTVMKKAISAAIPAAFKTSD